VSREKGQVTKDKLNEEGRKTVPYATVEEIEHDKESGGKNKQKRGNGTPNAKKGHAQTKMGGGGGPEKSEADGLVSSDKNSPNRTKTDEKSFARRRPETKKGDKGCIKKKKTNDNGENKPVSQGKAQPYRI